MMWIFLVLFYGLAKGGREICKKKALTKNRVIEVLFFYTLISFLLCLPQLPDALGMNLKQYLLVAVKSMVIFVAWVCSFKAIKTLPVSVMGILDLSRVIFATSLGVFFLGEAMGMPQIVGLALVAAGLLLLPVCGRISQKEKVEIKPAYVILALISCFLNAVSGVMDKYLMSTDMNSSQLQFWYMLFLLIYYGAYILIRRVHIDFRSLLKNYWVYILSVLFVLADKALFIANKDPSSRVTVMTLIKQSSVLVTILGGKFIFKEKNIAFKLICAAIIIVGIVIATVL